MTYTITVRIYQTNPNAFFNVVEKTVWHYPDGGFWTKINGEHVLTMGDSGTSGTLRLRSSDTDETIVATFGVHNHVRWCDIVTSFADHQTGMSIHPEHHDAGPSLRAFMREKQFSSFTVTTLKDRTYTINYMVVDGNNLKANLIIG